MKKLLCITISLLLIFGSFGFSFADSPYVDPHEDPYGPINILVDYLEQYIGQTYQAAPDGGSVVPLFGGLDSNNYEIYPGSGFYMFCRTNSSSTSRRGYFTYSTDFADMQTFSYSRCYELKNNLCNFTTSNVSTKSFYTLVDVYAVDPLTICLDYRDSNVFDLSYSRFYLTFNADANTYYQYNTINPAHFFTNTRLIDIVGSEPTPIVIDGSTYFFDPDDNSFIFVDNGSDHLPRMFGHTEYMSSRSTDIYEKYFGDKLPSSLKSTFTGFGDFEYLPTTAAFGKVVGYDNLIRPYFYRLKKAITEETLHGKASLNVLEFYDQNNDYIESPYDYTFRIVFPNLPNLIIADLFRYPCTHYYDPIVGEIEVLNNISDHGFTFLSTYGGCGYSECGYYGAIWNLEEFINAIYDPEINPVANVFQYVPPSDPGHPDNPYYPTDPITPGDISGEDDSALFDNHTGSFVSMLWATTKQLFGIKWPGTKISILGIYFSVLATGLVIAIAHNFVNFSLQLNPSHSIRGMTEKYRSSSANNPKVSKERRGDEK